MQATILVADALTGLATLPDQSVRTCVTSPPYWGLRDYGTGDFEGGDPSCDHVAPPTGGPSAKGQRGKFSSDGQYKDECKKCGAIRVDHQLGLEPTPEQYVENLVQVFREVKRVLTDDGTLWLNLGDSYCGAGRGGQSSAKRSQGWQPDYAMQHHVPNGLKAKDLVGIPWRVAFALQADGWYLRQDIIWAKPNPMPEPVKDRCTKSHEYIFLLSKQPRYYYDYEAIKEEAQNRSSGNDFKNRQGHADFQAQSGGEGGDECVSNGKKNKRDVWTIAPKPFKGAHFAVMPEALAEPCILAGSQEGDTVLDPFTGSGTVGLISLKHGRNFVGTELNPDFARIAEDRIGPWFTNLVSLEDNNGF